MNTKKKLLRDVELIKGSIKKWKKVVNGEIKGYGAENCPLCQEYVLTVDGSCGRCPVCLHTGLRDCDCTPYYDYVDSGSDVKKQNKAATEELNFLKELLNEYEAKVTA